MNIKKDWNEEISYQTEKMTVGIIKPLCKLKCKYIVWKEDNTLYCKKLRKEVKKGDRCNMSTIKCPKCGYDTCLSVYELPGKCPHCGALIE